MPADNGDLYNLLWSSAYLSVHRYGANPSGEVLLVMTIVLLDQADQHVTMSELAEITGLPKSNVSRYVSDQLRAGHLTEQIDPRDRRRRVLHPTDAGRKEQKWYRDRLLQLSQVRATAREEHGDDVDLVEMLLDLTRRFDLKQQDKASG